MIRATEILAHPVITDPEPNKLGLAEYLQRNVNDLYYFVNGLAAGSRFGNSNAPRLKQLEVVGKVPASQYALAAIGRLLKPLSPRGQTLLKAADMLAQADDPNSFLTPINTQGTHKEFDLPRRLFGDEAILKALRHRRELAAQYRDSNHPVEKVHLVTLLTHMYEVLVQSQRLFLSQNKEQIFPFTDEDVIRLAFAFHPEVRYAPHFTDRYIFRKILTQKSSAPIAIGRKRKGGSIVFTDLLTWMQSGPLQEMVRDIELPGFLSRKEFEDLIQHPDFFLWSLLTFDIFQKKILKKG